MITFTVAFLVAVHGITAKYPALDLSGLRIDFYPERLTELTAAG